MLYLQTITTIIIIMNRKRGLLLVSLIEMMIIFVITLLYVKGMIPMKLFITLLIIVTGLTSCAIVFIIKKLDP